MFNKLRRSNIIFTLFYIKVLTFHKEIVADKKKFFTKKMKCEGAKIFLFEWKDEKPLDENGKHESHYIENTT